MKELFEEQYRIYENHNIVITYFHHKDGYRIYFKDINKNYIHNPTTVIRDNQGKPVKVFHTGDFPTLKESLEWIINEVKIYINK